MGSAKTDENVSAFIEEALFAMATNVNFDMDRLNKTTANYADL